MFNPGCCHLLKKFNLKKNTILISKIKQLPIRKKYINRYLNSKGTHPNKNMINQLFYGVCINYRGLFMGLRLGGGLPHRNSKKRVDIAEKPSVQEFKKNSPPNSVGSGNSSLKSAQKSQKSILKPPNIQPPPENTVLSKAKQDASRSLNRTKATKAEKHPKISPHIQHPSTEAPHHLQDLFNRTTQAQSSAQEHADKALAAAAQARKEAANARAAANQNSQSRQNIQENENNPWKSLMKFFNI
jgi:hypothetical protein